ncbi:MAG: hypothetical protein WBA76_13365, partial [Phormidesmis sp.]
MESFQASLPSATLNGNGNGNHNGFPTVPIALPRQEPSSMLAAWQLNAQQEEDTDLRNVLAIVKRRA